LSTSQATAASASIVKTSNGQLSGSAETIKASEQLSTLAAEKAGASEEYTASELQQVRSCADAFDQRLLLLMPRSSFHSAIFERRRQRSGRSLCTPSTLWLSPQLIAFYVSLLISTKS
jgi:hypothetical protein